MLITVESHNSNSFKPVLKLGNPRLLEVSSPVESKKEAADIHKYLSHTLSNIESIYDFTRGSGISAPQIGLLKRAFLINFKGESYFFVNPEVKPISQDTFECLEGCLSFFDYRGTVARYRNIEVTASDLNGKDFTLKAQDELAGLIQHEADHLDGILYFHRIKGGFDALSRVKGKPAIP